MDNYKQCFSLSDIDPNNEFISATYQHPSHNPYFPESSTLHSHNSTALQQHLDIQRKRKSAMEIISSSSDTKNSVGGGKKGKRESKSAEVVHVRAKRGQATDSHSLAERVRREKINERLRCLQDIVQGCYKTMGMAVMLDEIINYVQSLQNQVEFLSMKLTAASSFHNFNSEAEALETMQRAKAYNAVNIENGGGPGIPSAQLGCNFQYCPQVPHNK